jgi:GNAT superfamily N-acetyltransferase
VRIEVRPASSFADVATMVGPTRPGHRRTGIAHHLVEGAVDFARAHGAPAIEGYPVDNDGRKVDLTMAYVGTRTLFERAGFVKVADTGSVINGFPRVLMRLDLRC